MDYCQIGPEIGSPETEIAPVDRNLLLRYN
jgi:hypothetical protein